MTAGDRFFISTELVPLDPREFSTVATPRVRHSRPSKIIQNIIDLKCRVCYVRNVAARLPPAWRESYSSHTELRIRSSPSINLKRQLKPLKLKSRGALRAGLKFHKCR